MNLALRSLSIYSLTCSATDRCNLLNFDFTGFAFFAKVLYDVQRGSIVTGHILITPCKDINVLSFDSHNLFFLCGAECATD